MSLTSGAVLSPTVTIPPGISAESFADEISCKIIEKYEKPLLSKMIDGDFSHLGKDERRRILDISLKNTAVSANDALSNFHYSVRKALVEADVRECLQDKGFVIPDGLVCFRLQDYKDELRRIYNAAADEFEAEKEYEEFLDMLRFFISVQTPQERLVHIINDNGDIRIQNRRRRDITQFYSREFTRTGETLTSEDVALSALIAIAPEKIIIHADPSENKLYSTIEQIFGEVVFLGC